MHPRHSKHLGIKHPSSHSKYCATGTRRAGTEAWIRIDRARGPCPFAVSYYSSYPAQETNSYGVKGVDRLATFHEDKPLRWGISPKMLDHALVITGKQDSASCNLQNLSRKEEGFPFLDIFPPTLLGREK